MDISQWLHYRQLLSPVIKKGEQQLPDINFNLLLEIPHGEALLEKMLSLIDPMVLEELGKVEPPPKRVGEEHPRLAGQYEGKIHKPTGILGWHATPQHAKMIDDQVAQTREAFLKQMPKTHHDTINQFFDKVMQHPHRHFRHPVTEFATVGMEQGQHEYALRANHIRRLLEGRSWVKLIPHLDDPKTITFVMYPHPNSPRDQVQHWVFSNGKFISYPANPPQPKKRSFRKTELFYKADRAPGKKIGGSIYVHKQYENTLPKSKLRAAKSKIGDFDYNIIKYNAKNGNFTFTFSPDWDDAHEPMVGHSLLVKPDGSVREMPAHDDPWIYHHKWQFVDDGYDGFDVDESKRRSVLWQGLEGVDKARIGKKSFWDKHVVPKLGKMEPNLVKSESGYKFSHFISKFKDEDKLHRVDDATHFMHVFVTDAENKPVGESIYTVHPNGLQHSNGNVIAAHIQDGYDHNSVVQMMHNHAEKITGKKMYHSHNPIYKVEMLWWLKKYCSLALSNMDLNKNETLDFLIKNKSIESYNRLYNFLQSFTTADLIKKIKDEDWDKFAETHKEDHTATVDHNIHLDKYPTYNHYKEFLNHPEEAEKLSDPSNGISSKLIHEVPNPMGSKDTIMVKPYHRDVDTGTKKWIKNPTLGWATMATKGLFDAANIGHLNEDVSMISHKNVPMTVHRFDNGFDDIYFGGEQIKSGEIPIDPLEWKQIGVMDFLTNNLDRHHNNLMVRTIPGDNGTHSLLAVDHERNFQYHKNPTELALHFPMLAGDEKTSKPSHFITTRGNEPIHEQMKQKDKLDHVESDKNLASWWIQNRHKIKDELENHLASIQDEHIRNHIRDNFHHRWNIMNDWAEDADRFGPENLGSPHEHDFYGDASLIPSQKPRNKNFIQFLERMDKNMDPLVAIDSIVDEMYGRKLDNNQMKLADEILSHFAKWNKLYYSDKISTASLLKLFNRSLSDPKYRHRDLVKLDLTVEVAAALKYRGHDEEDYKILENYYNNLPKGIVKDKMKLIIDELNKPPSEWARKYDQEIENRRAGQLRRRRKEKGLYQKDLTEQERKNPELTRYVSIDEGNPDYKPEPQDPESIKYVSIKDK